MSNWRPNFVAARTLLHRERPTQSIELLAAAPDVWPFSFCLSAYLHEDGVDHGD